MRDRVTTGFLNNNDGIILITSNNTTGLEPHIYQVDTLTNNTHFTAHAVLPSLSSPQPPQPGRTSQDTATLSTR